MTFGRAVTVGVWAGASAFNLTAYIDSSGQWYNLAFGIFLGLLAVALGAAPYKQAKEAFR
jgi:hypothetical protein